MTARSYSFTREIHAKIENGKKRTTGTHDPKIMQPSAQLAKHPSAVNQQTLDNYPILTN